ncbi:MAG: hypothetical protein A6F70_01795 [Cycloclasticus sp. symbiont of Bathymodiolus heckerae]|nr:MAG: hypothetical protein A6F70_01795 [Cycloclasticus sp. symbiont of Bathymodiolus heckerae]
MSSISFSVRKIDLIEFNEYHAKMNGDYGRSMTRHQILWPAIIMIAGLFVVLSTQDATRGLWFVTGAFVWSIGVTTWMKKRFHQHIVEQLSDESVEKAVGDYNLRLTAEGVMEVKPTGEELIEWGAIDRLERSKHHVYVYLDEHSAIIIPKEMLTEKSELPIFYAELVDKIKEYRAS